MGLATAQLLASRGAIISLADINAKAVESAASSLPGGLEKHMHAVVDVSASASVDHWIDSIIQQFGRLDGAANMAGIIKPARPVPETTDEDWDMIFNVNAKGVFNCIRAELKAMGSGKGSIVSPKPHQPLSPKHSLTQQTPRSPQPPPSAKSAVPETPPTAPPKPRSSASHAPPPKKTHPSASTASRRAPSIPPCPAARTPKT